MSSFSTYLLKQSDYFGRWNRRYFVVGSGSIAYYDTEKDAISGTEPRGTAKLAGATLTKPKAMRKDQPDAFRLSFANSPPSKYILAAESATISELLHVHTLLRIGGAEGEGARGRGDGDGGAGGRARAERVSSIDASLCARRRRSRHRRSPALRRCWRHGGRRGAATRSGWQVRERQPRSRS